MKLSLQGAILNVSDLDHSIEFYRAIFDLPLVSQRDQAAALMISETGWLRVLVLRQVGRGTGVRPGRGALGIRVLCFEASSPDELEVIADRLGERHALLGRERLDAYEVVVGVDPDRTEITVSSSLTGGHIGSEEWTHLDDLVYDLGE